jgi:hypothetical protein
MEEIDDEAMYAVMAARSPEGTRDGRAFGGLKKGFLDGSPGDRADRTDCSAGKAEDTREQGPPSSMPPVIGDVHERHGADSGARAAEPAQSATTRPVSKFKLSLQR